MKTIIFKFLIFIGFLAGLTILSNKCHAVKFRFVNDSNQTQIYMLYWVDHPWWLQYPAPANMAGGELAAGKIQAILNEYQAGEYIFTWRPGTDKTKYIKIEIPDSTQLVVSSPVSGVDLE